MTKVLKVWKKYSFLVFFAFIILSLFDMRIALAAIVCMTAPVIIAIRKGRYWCGNLCPRGNFYDNVISKISKGRKVPAFFRSFYLRMIMVIFLFTMFTLGIYQNWGNLYGIGMVFYRIIVITTLVGIILSLFYNHRTWCHFCPMGTLAAIISKLGKKKKVLQISSDCISCKLCVKKCPLGIVPYKYKGNSINHPDCIQCGKCVDICPKKAIGYHI
jgi:ferredoxin-type protein NapH